MNTLQNQQAESFSASWLFEAFTKELMVYRSDLFSKSELGSYTVGFKPWSYFDRKLAQKSVGMHRLTNAKTTNDHIVGVRPDWFLAQCQKPLEVFDMIMETAIHESCHVLQFQFASKNWKGKWPISHGAEWVREMRNMGIHKPSKWHGGQRWFSETDGQTYAHLFNKLWEEYGEFRQIAYEELNE